MKICIFQDKTAPHPPVPANDNTDGDGPLPVNPAPRSLCIHAAQGSSRAPAVKLDIVIGLAGDGPAVMQIKLSTNEG